MLRVAVTEESRSEPSYQVLLTTGNDTVRDILTRKHVNPDTSNIFVNGKLIKEFDKMLSTFTRETTIFITIKSKVIDRTRRASDK